MRRRLETQSKQVEKSGENGGERHMIVILFGSAAKDFSTLVVSNSLIQLEGTVLYCSKVHSYL